MSSEAQFFTLVFKGDIRELDKNPFKIATPYGLPFAAGIGNAFEDRDDMLAALKWARDIIGHPDDDGSKFIAEVIAKAEGRS